MPASSMVFPVSNLFTARTMPQPVITKDNVRMQIDTVVFFQITDCKLYAYGITNPLLAIENLLQNINLKFVLIGTENW